jgi:hypothetical protein
MIIDEWISRRLLHQHLGPGLREVFLAGRVPLSGGNLPALRDGGSLAHLLEPALEVRQVVDLDPRPGVDPHPRPRGDVRDRVIAREVLAFRQRAVENLVEPVGLLVVALDGEGDLLRGISEEDVSIMAFLSSSGRAPAASGEPLRGLRGGR